VADLIATTERFVRNAPAGLGRAELADRRRTVRLSLLIGNSPPSVNRAHLGDDRVQPVSGNPFGGWSSRRSVDTKTAQPEDIASPVRVHRCEISR
jgi:hypothetical protein